ncbi:hypothetical protein GEMRC1_004842 [Eukaryota sp. GEM-RC1]
MSSVSTVDNLISSLISHCDPLPVLDAALSKVTTTTDSYLTRLDELTVHINTCQHNRGTVAQRWIDLSASADQLNELFELIDSIESAILGTSAMVNQLDKTVTVFHNRHQDVIKGKSNPNESIIPPEIPKLESVLSQSSS